eukprot:scaffold256114_cov15-Tisochrysis_lutea.AAC.3
MGQHAVGACLHTHKAKNAVFSALLAVQMRALTYTHMQKPTYTHMQMFHALCPYGHQGHLSAHVRCPFVAAKQQTGPCKLETDTKGGVTTVRSSWTMKPRQLSKEEVEAHASKASGAGVGESGGSGGAKTPALTERVAVRRCVLTAGGNQAKSSQQERHFC